MNTDETTPEDMPENTGSNLLPSELALGQQGRTHIKDYERHSRSYDKTITAMHQDILGFGRVLLTGQEMYPSRKEFGYWIERRGLNTGRLAKHQTERTACMSFTRLVEDGVEIDEHDDSIVPVKLDLSGCKLTTPTDIMKWARKHHRHLFPHLPPKKEKEPGEKIAGDIKRELAADLAARDERIAELELELEAAQAKSEGQPLTLDQLREQTVTLLRDQPKIEQRREVRRLLKALDLNIRDFMIEFPLGATPSKAALTWTGSKDTGTWTGSDGSSSSYYLVARISGQYEVSLVGDDGEQALGVKHDLKRAKEIAQKHSDGGAS